MATDGHWTPASPTLNPEYVELTTHPDRYRHLNLRVEGAVATIELDVKEREGHRDSYALKLNSYDISVDVELADAVQRLRFEHPEVACVVITSATPGTFSSGANIFMLGQSSHGFKVNFCKYTNETRLYIEDATDFSGQTYLAACNGLASGGGYELPLACKEIYLVDDRKSAVSLPEVPLLGVLPGTGGLTRLVDKRPVRRDRADVFVTVAEGIKGKRAVDWGLVDGIFPSSRFEAAIAERAAAVAGGGHPERRGVALPTIEPTVEEGGVRYEHVDLSFGPTPRTATLTLTVPDELPTIPEDASELGADWFALKAWRELDDAILRLRFHYPEVGLVLLKVRGSIDTVLGLDGDLHKHRSHWFVNEVLLHMKRVLKRVDVTSKSFFAIVDEGSCFAGSFFELALASDRVLMLEADEVELAMSVLNAGTLPMGNGLSRLQTRFLSQPGHAEELSEEPGRFSGEEADEAGLVTMLWDDIDWEDELRVCVEERVSYSPDALTGNEASLRFAGPETLETKIFGRLSAWQNWIFQRPNAVGKQGALKLFGQPSAPVFDWNRT